MTIFQTESFDFFYYNPSNDLHNKTVESLVNDKLVIAQLYNIRHYLSQIDENVLNNAFLVGNKEGLIIGYLKLFYYKKFFNKQNFIDIQAAVETKFRTKKYVKESIACKMIRESTNYLINSYDNVRFIEGLIDEANIASINTALRAGFKKINRLTYQKNKPTEYIQTPKGLIK